MALDLTPLNWNWPAITAGDTFPAIQITETSSDTDLARVRVKVCDSDGTVQLTLDSDDTGVTIAATTAGAWDFTIDAISAATTEGLTAGLYAYDLETTDASGNVRTEFSGNWEILAQVTTA